MELQLCFMRCPGALSLNCINRASVYAPDCRSSSAVQKWRGLRAPQGRHAPEEVCIPVFSLMGIAVRFSPPDCTSPFCSVHSALKLGSAGFLGSPGIEQRRGIDCNRQQSALGWQPRDPADNRLAPPPHLRQLLQSLLTTSCCPPADFPPRWVAKSLKLLFAGAHYTLMAGAAYALYVAGVRSPRAATRCRCWMPCAGISHTMPAHLSSYHCPSPMRALPRRAGRHARAARRWQAAADAARRSAGAPHTSWR
jgi:hypothetical protein